MYSGHSWLCWASWNTPQHNLAQGIQESMHLCCTAVCSGSRSVRSAPNEPSAGLKSWMTAPGSPCNAGIKFLAGKKVLLGQWGWWLLEMFKDKQNKTAQAAKSRHGYTCLQRMLKGVCELLFINLWIFFIYEPIALQPIQNCCWTTKLY